MELERGVELLIGLEAISEPDERGMRTVMCILNGQLRPVVVRDRSVASAVPAAEKADRANPDHIAAPFAGRRHARRRRRRHRRPPAHTIATIEAMKMEAAITAPHGGHACAAGRFGDRAGRRRRPAGGGQSCGNLGAD